MDETTLAGATMTPRQITLGRHALGIHRCRPEAERNYFIASARTADKEQWDAMVISGWATAKPYALAIGDTVYRLTEAGELLVRATTPGTEGRDHG